MKILIALNENKELNSKLSEHFGHCPYFAIYKTETKELNIVKNKINHLNSDLNPVEQIVKFQPRRCFYIRKWEKKQ